MNNELTEKELVEWKEMLGKSFICGVDVDDLDVEDKRSILRVYRKHKEKNELKGR